MSRFSAPPHPRLFLPGRAKIPRARSAAWMSTGHPRILRLTSLREKGAITEADARTSPPPLREREGVRGKNTKQLSKNLRKNQTDAEIKMWRHLKNRALAGYKFRRQCPIGPYIVDFVCFETMLIVEIDGGQHAIQIQKDARRTEQLESRGFRVLRFWNNEVLTSTESVLHTILTTLLSSPSSPALLSQGEGCVVTAREDSMATHARSSVGPRIVAENVSLSLRERAGVRAEK